MKPLKPVFSSTLDGRKAGSSDEWIKIETAGRFTPSASKLHFRELRHVGSMWMFFRSAFLTFTSENI